MDNGQSTFLLGKRCYNFYRVLPQASEVHNSKVLRITKVKGFKQGFFLFFFLINEDTLNLTDERPLRGYLVLVTLE